MCFGIPKSLFNFAFYCSYAHRNLNYNYHNVLFIPNPWRLCIQLFTLTLSKCSCKGLNIKRSAGYTLGIVK
jgi:hypothetical protein